MKNGWGRTLGRLHIWATTEPPVEPPCCEKQDTDERIADALERIAAAMEKIAARQDLTVHEML